MGAHYRAASPSYGLDRLSAIVLEDRLSTAGSGAVRDLIGRPVAIDPRLLHREIARARRPILRCLSLRPVFTALRADVARRRHGLFVRLHVLRERRQSHQRQKKKKRACARFFQYARHRYFVVGAVSVLVEDEVLLFVLESMLVLPEALGVVEVEPELELGVLELVLGALEPPAALESLLLSLPLCFDVVEPLLD